MKDEQGQGQSEGTVGKALEVLEQIAAFGRPVRFAELQAGSAFPKATLYRLAHTLVALGLLEHDEERHTYAPGLHLVRLAHGAWSQAALPRVARRHLDALSEHLHETAHLARLDHGQVLYLDKRNAREPVEMFSQAGRVGPAYCTGLGKVLLAGLAPDDLDRAIALQSFHRFTPATITDAAALRAEIDRIRAAGHGFDREEHEPGIICIAVPILTAAGRTQGALSVTSTTDRTGLDGLARHLPLLQDTAATIAAEARDWQFPEAPRPAGQGQERNTTCPE